MTTHDRVVIETGRTRVFASAIDWPGWSRSAKTEAAALAALADYAERYRVVADLAGTAGVLVTAGRLTVVDRLPGNATTDFGAPGVPSALEDEPMPDAGCDRQLRLFDACWATFDAVAARVSAELRKGPRGGGRDRDKLVDHTHEAERSYVRQIGVRTPPRAMGTPKGLAAHRDAVRLAIREADASGERPGGWSVRYMIRRAAWHVMDHAWEMEDKDLTEEAGPDGHG